MAFNEKADRWYAENNTLSVSIGFLFFQKNCAITFTPVY